MLKAMCFKEMIVLGNQGADEKTGNRFMFVL